MESDYATSVVSLTRVKEEKRKKEKEWLIKGNTIFVESSLNKKRA